jgi:hypothetical protein
VVTSIERVLGVRAAKLLLITSAASAVLGIGISGCGHAAAVGRDRTLHVALSEYRVIPQNVRVSAGLLTILVRNDGKLTHNLAVLHGDQRIDVTPPLWPGTGGQLSVVLAPGRYTLESTLFSDQALGAYGTLTVTS